MKVLLLFLVVIALASGAVNPFFRLKRALPMEQEVEAPDSAAATTTSKPTNIEICHAQTPCLWQVYKPNAKYDSMYIPNSYCICENGTTCQQDEDKTEYFSFVYRCKGEPTETTETTN